MLSVLLLQAATLIPATPAAGATLLHVDGDYLTLAHLAAPGDIPAAAGGDFRLLKAPHGVRSIVLTLDDQKRLLHRRLPVFRIAPRTQHDVRVEFARSVNGNRRAPCLALNQPIGVGDPVDRAQASVVPCDHMKRRVLLSYSEDAGAPAARVALPAGAYLGPVLLPLKLPHRRGSEMTLRTRVGPVTVERSARLVQAGRPGRNAFVALSDGRVVAAPLPAEEGNGDDAS
ncbi:hypothetical protein FHR22_001655 [Sphingopyxis panaciterrae]|uniref:hypothetical protein n=1 Tax=Sphingopyxis panaciterrae TaxID=363841 RepID=UPI0014234B12|nr:hypothetical protein [Sphingopyxis panaciterrae]NIJ36971.1 hypothetical protein [Sphingopyxis panaciterrae]